MHPHACQKPKSLSVVAISSDPYKILHRGRTPHKEDTGQILSKSKVARAPKQRLKPKTKLIANRCTHLELPRNFKGGKSPREIIRKILESIQVGTSPHTPLEARQMNHSLIRFGQRLWAHIGSSDDPLPPTDPPLCPLLDYGVGPSKRGFDRHEK